MGYKKKMVKLISSFVVLILCFLTSFHYIFPSRCHGIVEGLWTLLFSSLTILVLSIFLIIGIIRKIKFNKKINLFPFFTFGISILSITLIIFLRSDRFKSEIILIASGNSQDLYLRKNGEYELIMREPEYSCTETGQYKISNDTLYLFEEPEITQTLVKNEVFLVNKEMNRLIPIPFDTMDLIQHKYLEIRKYYNP